MQDDEVKDRGENPTRWIMDIQAAISASKKWREEAKKIEKRYRGEKQSDYAQGTQYQKRSGNEHNILWSNVRFLLPAIFKERQRQYADRHMYHASQKTTPRNTRRLRCLSAPYFS